MDGHIKMNQTGNNQNRMQTFRMANAASEGIHELHLFRANGEYFRSKQGFRIF